VCLQRLQSLNDLITIRLCYHFDKKLHSLNEFLLRPLNYVFFCCCLNSPANICFRFSNGFSFLPFTKNIHRHSSGGNGSNSSNEKPFVCPVPGCKKRYKNVNGIKYHSKNGHKKDGK
jgi:hypothetical protein